MSRTITVFGNGPCDECGSDAGVVFIECEDDVVVGKSCTCVKCGRRNPVDLRDTEPTPPDFNS